MGMPRIPGRPGANPAKGYAQPKFAFASRVEVMLRRNKGWWA